MKKNIQLHSKISTPIKYLNDRDSTKINPNVDDLSITISQKISTTTEDYYLLHEKKSSWIDDVLARIKRAYVYFVKRRYKSHVHTHLHTYIYICMCRTKNREKRENDNHNEKRKRMNIEPRW